MKEFFEFSATGIPDFILYPSISFVIVFIIVVSSVRSINKKFTLIMWALFVEYLFVVICSTVLCRPQMLSQRIEIAPFWTYGAVINNVQGVSYWDIILNIVLFIPFGFFVSILFPSFSRYSICFCGFICSFLIELSQFILWRGIAQFDDLLHNTVGCYIGCIFAHYLIKLLTSVH